MTLAQVKAARPTLRLRHRVRRHRRLDARAVRRSGLQEPVRWNGSGRRRRARRAPWSVVCSPAAASLVIGRRTGAVRPGAAASGGRAPPAGGRGGRAQPPRPRAARAGRPHRLLGVGRHRRLALADGDAGQGRLRGRAAERRPAARSARRGIRRRTRRRASSAGPTAPPAIMRVPGRLRHHLAGRHTR